MTLSIHILTLFPGMFEGPFNESIIRRAIDRDLATVSLHNLRNFAYDKRHTVDDAPYGGGPGMVMKIEPFFLGISAIKDQYPLNIQNEMAIVLLTPQGARFDQSTAQQLARRPCLLFLCGHYEGVDERVRQNLITHEISIGDYILTGGELASMVVIDAVIRQIPGVLGSNESGVGDSFSSGFLQHPVYTRPVNYNDWAIPEILLSGDHRQIIRWRREKSLLRTFQHRPDLLDQSNLTNEDLLFLKSHGYHHNQSP